MAKNRADLRTALRDKISAWPELVTTTTEVLDATELGVDLAAVNNITERCMLEIDSEVMVVLSVSSLTATVIRGARGTTAATHSSGATVKVYPSWSWPDAALNRMVDKATNWFAEGGVWTLVPITNTFLSGYREFGLPAGVVYPNGNHVKILEILQADGTYVKSLNWKHVGDRITLPTKLGADISVRMWIQTQQLELTDDVTNLDSTRYLEPLELYMASRCLEEFLANRTRYTDYSATLNDRASSLDELQRQAYFFNNQAVILRNEMSRPGLSGQASFHPS